MAEDLAPVCLDDVPQGGKQIVLVLDVPFCRGPRSLAVGDVLHVFVKADPEDMIAASTSCARRAEHALSEGL
jgi:hypothetical protein